MRIGIDLGNSYALVARVNADGTPLLLPDCVQQDLFHTPSVVCFASQAAYVGRTAEALLDEEPHLVALRYFKRSLGTAEPICFDARGAGWRAEALAALILKKLRYDAETSGDAQIDGGVITVPAHFTDPQRRAVIAAAMMADLPVMHLVEEPVAAALHYGATVGADDRVVLVFDWGGGTCDVSVVACQSSGLTVLSKAGVADLGGKELDDAVAALLLSGCDERLRTRLSSTARTLLDLRRAAEALKIELCATTRPVVRRTLLMGDLPLDVRIAVYAFDEQIGPLLDRCQALALECVRSARLEPDDIDDVLLVGGSSMVPAIRDRMERLFPERVRYHEPGKAVAFGAAIHALQLSGDAEALDLPPTLRGVSGHATGVRVVDPHTGRVTFDAVVPQNVPLPGRATRTFFTTRAEQERIVLEIVQFRPGDGQETYLGDLVVGPLARPRLNYPVDVTIEVRADSTVAVSAYDAESGLELEQLFSRDDASAAAALARQHALVRATPVNHL